MSEKLPYVRYSITEVSLAPPGFLMLSWTCMTPRRYTRNGCAIRQKAGWYYPPLLDFVNNTMRFAVMYCTILSRSPFRFSARKSWTFPSNETKPPFCLVQIIRRYPDEIEIFVHSTGVTNTPIRHYF